MNAVTDHWRCGKEHRVRGRTGLASVGLCIAVTHERKGRIRWVKLEFVDGSVESFAPAQVVVLPETA